MLKVLLVDDEPFIVQGLAVLIDWEKEGYEIVSTAANGADALEYLRENEVDLIIADIKMPVMSGLKLLETIRSENISEAYFVILSGYNDFHFAQQAIRYKCMEYILKPIRQEELSAVLKKVASLHKTSCQAQEEGRQRERAFLARNIISLLSGKYDRQNLIYVTEKLSLSPQIRYIDIEIDEQEQEEHIPKEKKRALQRKLYMKCLEYLGEAYSNYCVFDVSNHDMGYDIGFIYCSQISEQQGLTEQEYISEFLEYLIEQMKLPVVMFVGSSVSDISEISKSYHTAIITKSFQTFRSSQSIHYYEEKDVKNPSGKVLCKNTLDDLMREIERNNSNGIKENVNILYEEMDRIGMDSDTINLNTNYLLFQMIHLAAELDSDINQEEIMQLISKKAFDGRSVWSSKEHLKHFVDEYAKYLIQLRKNASGGVLVDIEREIREHYSENITLKDLSKKYYVNSAYLGQIFRKKYEMSFKDYLNNYRIEQAERLLLRTDKRVYEIAEEVGYRDLDYFINRFIILKGCTPAKYRKQMKESETG